MRVAAKLVDGWSSAVLLASVVSIAGALVIAAIGAYSRTGDSQIEAHVKHCRSRSAHKKSGLTVCSLIGHDAEVTNAKVASPRVPQEERTRAMRQRLLEATVECLVEHGWSGTSTTLVSQRAGVSRGAQLHHFPTKTDLVVAAVEHLSEVRGEELREAAMRLPSGKRRTRAVLEMFADHFTSPVFTAALELWVAARTDESLHAAVVPLEQRVGREAHRIAVDALGRGRDAAAGPRAGPGDARPGPRARAGQHDHRRHRPAAQDPQRLGAHPRRGAEAGVNTAPTNSVLEQVLGDLDAESAALEAMVAPLDEAGWRTPTPAAGWDIATQVAHLAWTDEVAVAAATDKEQWDAFVIEAIADPMGYVDVEALEGGKAAPADLLARWRQARPGLDEALRNYPDGAEDAVVRTADEPHLDGDGAVHGDLGALARRGRGARRRARAERPDPARGPPRRTHPQLRLRGALARAADRGVPGRAAVALR